MPISFTAKLSNYLSRIGKNGTENPDQQANSPVSKLLGELFIWQTTEKFAAARKRGVEKKLTESGEVTPPDESGEFQLAASPHFSYVANITEPVKQFDADYLIQLLAKSKYRVPVAASREMIEKSKRPAKRRVTKRVVEIGVDSNGTPE